MAGARCPICGEPCLPRDDDNGAFPFCSHRCQMVDLSRWLDEAYRIPGEPAEGGPASDFSDGDGGFDLEPDDDGL